MLPVLIESTVRGVNLFHLVISESRLCTSFYAESSWSMKSLETSSFSMNEPSDTRRSVLFQSTNDDKDRNQEQIRSAKT